MMYVELCEAWRRELVNKELEKLPPDFWLKVADYVRKLREETRMLDRRTLKGNLLKKEVQNVRRSILELARLRYRKIAGALSEGDVVSAEALSPEEERISRAASSMVEAYQNLARNILRGQLPKTDVERKNRFTVLRFLKEVPAIVGADMKVYGPFRIDDVASLPVENANVLSKQGLAEIIEA
jgi:DNA replication factor GINS